MADLRRKWSLTIDKAAKPVGVGAVSQLWIIKGEPSGLLTHIAAESVTLCERMKS